MNAENFEPRSPNDKRAWESSISRRRHPARTLCHFSTLSCHSEFDPSERPQLSHLLAHHPVDRWPYQTLWLAASAGQPSQLPAQDSLLEVFVRMRSRGLKMTGEDSANCDCDCIPPLIALHARPQSGPASTSTNLATVRPHTDPRIWPATTPAISLHHSSV